MKALLPLLAILLFAPLSLRAETYRSAAIGVTFPATLGDFTLNSTHDYEAQSPGLGTSVKYLEDRIRIDVYIYTAGLQEIPNDLSSEVVRSHLKSNIKEIFMMQEMGKYQDVKVLGAPEETSIGPLPALKASLTFTSDGPLISFIYLGVLKNHFLKIRCTYPAEGAAASQRKVDVFLRELGRVL